MERLALRVQAPSASVVRAPSPPPLARQPSARAFDMASAAQRLPRRQDSTDGKTRRYASPPLSLNASKASPHVHVRARTRCRKCAGCLAPECGKCINCKDMPKRGGRGLRRQPCKGRVCFLVRAAQEEREAEKLRRNPHLQRASTSDMHLAPMESDDGGDSVEDSDDHAPVRPRPPPKRSHAKKPTWRTELIPPPQILMPTPGAVIEVRHARSYCDSHTRAVYIH